MISPKDGQTPEEIKRIWASELENISDEQLKKAVRVLIRSKKSMTFPTLAHIKEVLSSIPPEETEEKRQNPVRCAENILRERYEQKCSRYLPTSEYRRIVKFVLQKKLPQFIRPEEYRAVELSEKQACRPLFAKADELGLFADIDALLFEMNNGGNAA